MSTTSATVRPARSINRWSILIAAAAVMLCTGCNYAFSVWSLDYAITRGWVEAGATVPPAAMATAFAINAGIAPIPMILGGMWVDRQGARWALLVGGLMYGLGWVISSIGDSPAMLYLGYGVVTGLGQGFAYASALGNVLRFFPDKRGTAAGLITAANGAATIYAAPLAQGLITAQGVDRMLLLMGGAFMVVAVVAALFTKPHPEGWIPEGYTPPEPVAGVPAVTSMTWKQMMSTPTFWLMFFTFVFSAFAGFIIASQAKQIGTSPAMWGLGVGFVAVLVSVYAAANTAGRFVFGSLSDRIGYTRTLLIILGVVAASLVVLALTKGIAAGFVVGLLGIGLTFGGVLAVFPALTMKNFGPRYQGVNYGIMFAAYSVSAFFAPRLSGGIAKANGGDYTNAFWIAIGAAVLGLVLVTLLRRRMIGAGHGAA